MSQHRVLSLCSSLPKKILFSENKKFHVEDLIAHYLCDVPCKKLEWMWYKFQKTTVHRYSFWPNSDLIFLHAAIEVKKRNGRSWSHAEYIAIYPSTKPE